MRQIKRFLARQTAVTSCCQLVIPPPPQELLARALQPAPGLGPAVVVNSAVFLLGIRVLQAGLMPSAVALSWVLGTAVYAAFGLGGYALVCLYFVFGSAVRTSIQHNALQHAHIAMCTLQCKVHQHTLQQPREARAVPGNIDSSTWELKACAAAHVLQHNITCQTAYRSALQVTKVKLEQKQREGIAEARSGRRSTVLLFCRGAVHQCLFVMSISGEATTRWAACCSVTEH